MQWTLVELAAVQISAVSIHHNIIIMTLFIDFIRTPKKIRATSAAAATVAE